MPQQTGRFGAAECRNVALPYFQPLHRIATSAYAFAAWEPARRIPREFCAMTSRYGGIVSQPEEALTSLWARFACH